MKATILSLALLLTANLASGQSSAQLVSTDAFSIGEAVVLSSALLQENRQINIYLPASYRSDSATAYPVIYLLDGGRDEDFIHVSGLVQFGSFPWIDLLPESIVVGIANVDRKRDFTYPSRNALDQEEFPTSGKSEAFIAFLANELIPFMEAGYRTSAEKTLIGQSLGGLLATEVLFTEPDLFDNYIIVSPSLWWDDERLLAAEPVAYEAEKAVYIAGGKEGEVMERTTKELYEKLRRNQRANTHLFYDYLADREHGDALHLAVYHAFERMF